MDRNGPALVGDPDLGFGGLQKFGDVLVNHTMLKIRSDTRIKDFCLVDSPGMIDSPIDHSRSAAISTSAKGRQLADNSNYDRGYDFAGVCRFVGSWNFMQYYHYIISSVWKMYKYHTPHETYIQYVPFIHAFGIRKRRSDGMQREPM